MYSKLQSLALIALALVMGVAAFVLPAQPALAQGGTPQAPLITSVNCTLTVEFAAAVTTDAYNVQIWDDGAQVYNEFQTAATVGEVLSFTYTFTTIGTAAAGVGIDVYEGTTLTFSVDPYTDIDQTCNPAAPAVEPGCPIGFPSGSVVGTFVAPAQLYSVPGQLVTPGLSLEAGKSAWVIGLDASGQYYKIFFACKLLWVQANTLGPNFDKVWNGTPLPNRTVTG